MASPLSALAQVPLSDALSGKSDQAAQIEKSLTVRGVTRIIVRLEAPRLDLAATAGPQAIAAARPALAQAAKAAKDAVLQTHAGGDAARAKRLGIVDVPGEPILGLTVTESDLRALAADGRIARIWLDEPMRPHLAESVPLVNAPIAFANGFTGAGKTIAIIDTGVQRAHPAFRRSPSDSTSRVVDGACIGLTELDLGWESTCLGLAQLAFGSAAGEPCADLSFCDHGTHVAAIAAGGNYHPTTPSAGMAPEASLIAVNVASRLTHDIDCLARYGTPAPCHLIWTINVVTALAWLRDLRVQEMNGAYPHDLVAINMSLGGGPRQGLCNDDIRTDLIAELTSLGVAVVVAAGNEGQVNALNTPACVEQAIAVGSSTKSDEISGFSNMSSHVKIMAPGSAIEAAVPVSTLGVLSGTSMAAPHVSGAIALAKQARPSATVTQMIAAMQAGSGPSIVDTRPGGIHTKYRLDVQGFLTALGHAFSTNMVVSPKLANQSSMLLANYGSLAKNDFVYTLSNVGGTGNTSWSLVIDQPPGLPQVSASATSGTIPPGDSRQVTLSLTPNVAFLPAGRKTYVLRFINNSVATNGTTYRYIHLDVATPGRLTVSPDFGFSAEGPPGTYPSPGFLQYTLKNDGGLPLNWNVTKTASVGWIDAIPASGSLDPGKSVNVTLTHNGTVWALPLGVHTGTVSFNNTSGGQGNTSRPVTVAIKPPAKLDMTGLNLVWNTTGPPGGPFSVPNFTYGVRNSGTLDLNWTATSPNAWVSLSPSSGTLKSGEVALVTASLGAGANALAIGNHPITINFRNVTSGSVGLGDSVRSGTLSVIGQPVLAVNETTGFNPVGPLGGPFAPLSRTYTVRNAGSATLSWSASTNKPWMTVSPASGSLAPGASVVTTVSLTAAAASQPGGQQQGSIAFANTSAGAGNGNGDTRRTATLTIAAPVLNVAGVSDLSASGNMGGPFTPTSGSYTLRNAGAATLNWAVGASTTWVDVTPSTGTLAAGGATTVTISLNSRAANLGAGLQVATLVFTNRDNGLGDTRRAFNLNVVGPSLSVLDPEGFVSAGTAGGPFAPALKTYELRQGGSGPVSFSVTADKPWITLTPPSGTIPVADRAFVDVRINATANTLPAGTHEALVTFSNTTGGTGTTRRIVSLVVSPPVATGNNNFASAATLSGASGSVTANNGGATRETGEPVHFVGTTGNKSLWWRWVAPATGQATFTTQGSSFDTVLAAYSGASLATLTQLMSNDDAGGTASRISFHAVSGTTYTIAVDGFNPTSSGNIVLAWSLSTAQGASGLGASILPYARSVQVGSTATAFANIVNASGSAATGCYLQMPAGLAAPGTFQYQTTNAANQLTGIANAPVDVASGATQNFVLAFRPSAAFASQDIPVIFDCADKTPATTAVGVNTFLLAATTTPSPDLVAIGATASGDGIVRIPSPSAAASFAAAAVNIGAAGTITASADDGGRGLPVTLTICQTNASGACLAAPSASVTGPVAASQVVTYSVFVQASGSVAFNPSANRLFLRLREGSATRGATHVAVCTVPGCPTTPPQPVPLEAAEQPPTDTRALLPTPSRGALEIARAP